MIQKGTFTGIHDSNGKKICSGDTIRYEYVFGFNLSEDGAKLPCFPFQCSEPRSHEKIIEYEVRDNCAGFFLDTPQCLTICNLLDTLKYYVVSEIKEERPELPFTKYINSLPATPTPTVTSDLGKIEDLETQEKGSFKVRAAVIIFHKNVNSYPKKWILECIDSIKNQTYKNFDVFEIDYGGEGIQIYEGSNFQSIKMDNHALAHNYLLDKVFSKKHAYDCAFNVNIDDKYSHERFEKQIVHMETGYDVVASNYYNMDEDSNPIKAMVMDDLNADIEASNGHNIIAHPVVCYSKKFWTTCTRLNGSEIPVDDFELWKRSYSSGKYKFLILPDFLLYYRVHEQKVSAQ